MTDSEIVAWSWGREVGRDEVVPRLAKLEARYIPDQPWSWVEWQALERMGLKAFREWATQGAS